MGLDQAFASLQRANTEAFIEYRPENVTLIRSSRVSDGMGGIVNTTPLPLLPQLMRLIPAKSVSEEAPVRVTTDGQQITPNWFLLAFSDADIKVGDTTTVRAHKLEVVFISDLPDARIVAECWENL